MNWRTESGAENKKKPTLLSSEDATIAKERGHRRGHLCEYAYGRYSVRFYPICLPEMGGGGLKKKHVFVFTDG